MSKKLSKDGQTYTFTSKKDFGLGEYRLSLPNNEVRSAPMVVQEDTDKSKKAKRFSQVGGRVKKLLKKSQQEPQCTLVPEGFTPAQDNAHSYQVGPNCFNDDTSSLASSGRPSPALHSRMIKKGFLDTDGIRGSLENLEEYGRKKKEKIERAVGKMAASIVILILLLFLIRIRRVYQINYCFTW